MLETGKGPQHKEETSATLGLPSDGMLTAACALQQGSSCIMEVEGTDRGLGLGMGCHWASVKDMELQESVQQRAVCQHGHRKLAGHS